jgi:hypothetical protein
MNKNSLILFFSLATFILLSCKEQKPAKTKIDEKSTICYIAIDKTDTAWLKVDTADQQRILGELVFNFHNEKHYKGLIKAVIKGDTLKGNYSFRVNDLDKWYKNPIALLKNKRSLTMGVGEIYTLWGSGFFLKSVPIDYGKGRFVFEQIECAIKD